MNAEQRLIVIAIEMERSVQALRDVGCDDEQLLAGNATIASDLRTAAKRLSNLLGVLAIVELQWERGEDWRDHRDEVVRLFALAEELRQ